MRYEYTDHIDHSMNIVPIEDKILVRVRDDREMPVGVYITTEDAPAVALAILEAAGITDESTPTLASAYSTLRRHAETQKREAEREAEDAKDDKPAPRVLQYGDPEPDRRTRWRDVGGDVWRFGMGERVGGTVWEPRNGLTGSAGWYWANLGGERGPSRAWRRVSSVYFPMTEVTGDAR